MKPFTIFLFVFSVIFSLANQQVMQDFGIEGFPITKSVTFDPYFRTDYGDRIETEQPDIVMVGDSAIRELDEAVFSKEIGRKTTIFSFPGSASTKWYLFLRNSVMPSDQPPAFALIFFRSTVLTSPQFLVHGSYLVRIEEVATPEDEDVYQIAIARSRSPLVNWLEQYLPIFAYRSEIYFNWVESIRNYLPELLKGCDGVCVSNAFDLVFDDSHINALLWEDQLLNLDQVLYTEEALDFEARVGESLLPMMIADLKARGIQPVFVRTSFRTHTEGQSDDEEVAAYLAQLEGYIEGQGGLFIDLAGLPGLRPDMYRDNLHFSDEAAREATVIIAQHLRNQLYINN